MSSFGVAFALGDRTNAGTTHQGDLAASILKISGIKTDNCHFDATLDDASTPTSPQLSTQLARLKLARLARRPASSSSQDLGSLQVTICEGGEARQGPSHGFVFESENTVSDVQNQEGPASRSNAMNVYNTSSMNLDALQATLSQKPALALEATSLLRRLRQVSIRRAFHMAKAQPVNELLASHQPWLPANAKGGSKHCVAQRPASASGSTAVTEASRSSRHASALRFKLLTDLQDRLRKKLGLVALRLALERRRLRHQSMDFLQQNRQRWCLQSTFHDWRDSATIKLEHVELSKHLYDARLRNMAGQVLMTWRTWSVKRQRKQAALARALQLYEHRLVLAAFDHYRVYWLLGYVASVRRVLAEEWSYRLVISKAFAAWRKVYVRAETQRRALCRAATSTPNVQEYVGAQQLLPSDSLCLALPPPFVSILDAVRKEVEPWRECIGNAFQQLITRRQALRWSLLSEWKPALNEASLPAMPQPVYNPAAYSSPVKNNARQQRSTTADALATELFMYKDMVVAAKQECLALLSSIHEAEAAAVNSRKRCTEAKERLVDAQNGVAMANTHHDVVQQAYNEAQAVLIAALRDQEDAEQRLTASEEAASIAQAVASSASTDLSSAENECEQWSNEVKTRRLTLATAAGALSRAVKAADQSVALVKVKEARHRVEHAQDTLVKIKSTMLEFTKAAEAATERACAAYEEVVGLRRIATAAREALVAAQVRAANTKSDLVKGTKGLESANFSLKKAEEEVRLMEERVTSLDEDRHQMAGKVLTKELEIEVIRRKIEELEMYHKDAVATALEELLSDPPLALEAPNFETTSDEPDSRRNMSKILAEPQMLLTGAPPTLADESNQMTSPQNASPSWSITSTPLTSPRDFQRSVSGAAAYFRRQRVIDRALAHWREYAAWVTQADSVAALRYCLCHLPRAFTAWKKVAQDSSDHDSTVCDRFRLAIFLKTWRRSAIRNGALRHAEMHVALSLQRSTKRRCLMALTAHAATQKRCREALVIRTRRYTVAVLTAWAARATYRKMMRERLQGAETLGLQNRLFNAFACWRVNVKNVSLLRRVFGRAVEWWKASSGAALYENEFVLLSRCVFAWQLAAHAQTESRRWNTLSLAANSKYERMLLTKAFAALRESSLMATHNLCPPEERLPTARVAFIAWKAVHVRSEGNVALEMARRHHAKVVAGRTLQIWRNYATAMACRVSMFWMRWRVDDPCKRALQVWRQIVTQKRRWESRRLKALSLQQRVSGDGPPPSHAGTVNTSSASFSGEASCSRSAGPGMVWLAKADDWRQRRELYLH